jgi:hypothetical protein
VVAVSAATVGALLASRRPRHPVGWLLLGLGRSLTVHDLTFSYTRYGLVARPGALPSGLFKLSAPGCATRSTWIP